MRRPGVRALLLPLVVALAVLAGCTKPVPSVTIQASGTSLRSEAVQYVIDGKQVGTSAGPKVLTVKSGDVLNISVDKQTAEAGWVVLLGGQKVSPVLGDENHHYSFAVPGFSGGSEATLAIFEQPPNGGPASGSWIFTLRQEI